MTDQAQRTEWALESFNRFVENWVAPAMLEYVREDDDQADRVRRAIRAIAPPATSPIVGYAVFGQKPDRKKECGFEHVAVSAVFDDLAQAQNLVFKAIYDAVVKDPSPSPLAIASKAVRALEEAGYLSATALT